MPRILLIEPDRRLGETYTQALTADGHQVVTVPGAQAAITAADAARPDIVIIELQLVEHSGIEFLYEFRSYIDWQTIPVIIHSQVPPAEFSDSRQLLETELGVHTYLYKPRTSLRQLLAQVQALTPVTT
ncbi:MAG TPA: response regulator [Candidatus Saccharimonadales bacterium]